MDLKREKRKRRHKRIRASISGNDSIPRLCVFRSLQHIYVQLIDDRKNRILFSASDLGMEKKKPAIGQAEDKKLSCKRAIAFEVGKSIAKKAREKKIEKIVFDRGGYKYHGRVKALAEGARTGGLKF